MEGVGQQVTAGIVAGARQRVLVVGGIVAWVPGNAAGSGYRAIPPLQSAQGWATREEVVFITPS